MTCTIKMFCNLTFRKECRLIITPCMFLCKKNAKKESRSLGILKIPGYFSDIIKLCSIRCFIFQKKRGWILLDFGKIIILLDDVWKLFLLYCFSFESSFLFLCTCECACVCVFRLKKWKLTDVHQPFKLIHPWRFIKFGQIFLVSLLFDFVVLLNHRYYSGIHYL